MSIDGLARRKRRQDLLRRDSNKKEKSIMKIHIEFTFTYAEVLPVFESKNDEVKC